MNGVATASPAVENHFNQSLPYGEVNPLADDRSLRCLQNSLPLCCEHRQFLQFPLSGPFFKSSAKLSLNYHSLSLLLLLCLHSLCVTSSQLLGPAR